MEIRVTELAEAALRCAVCRDGLGHFQAVCPGCGTRLHFACRAMVGRCPTLGCPHGVVEPVRVPALRSSPRPAPRQPFPWGRILSTRALVAYVVLASLSAFCHLVKASVHFSPDRCTESRALADLKALEDAISLYRLNMGEPPQRLSDLWTAPASEGRWRGPYVKDPGCVDPWGRPYVYWGWGSRGFELLSYGADGAPGGEGLNADIVLRSRPRR